MWTTPKSWATGGGGWRVADANTYIRDNFKSVRNFAATSGRGFTDVGTATTSVVAYSTHLNLAIVTPDEPFNFSVITQITISAVSATLTLTARIRDHAAAAISPDNYYRSILGSVERGSIALVGHGSYAAGVNPGFTVELSTNTGTATVAISTVIHINPTTT